MRLLVPAVLLPAAAAWLLLGAGYVVGTQVSCDEPIAAQDAAVIRGLFVMLAGAVCALAAAVAGVHRLRSRREAVTIALGGIGTAVAAPFLNLLTFAPVLVLLSIGLVHVRMTPPELRRAAFYLWIVSWGWFVAAPFVALKTLTHCGVTLF